MNLISSNNFTFLKWITGLIYTIVELFHFEMPLISIHASFHIKGKTQMNYKFLLNILDRIYPNTPVFKQSNNKIINKLQTLFVISILW